MAINLNRTTLRVSAGTPKQFPADPIPQVAFSGRSNVGKSSLINLLLGRKSMARVSSAPGKTITVNFYDLDGKLFFVDLPGYGFAKRTKEDQARWSGLTDGYFTANRNIDRLKLVVQLIDSRIGPTKDDEMMLDFLGRTGIPFLVVATKCDKLNKTERKQTEELLKNHPLIPGDTPIFFLSAQSGEGKEELKRQIGYFTGVQF